MNEFSEYDSDSIVEYTENANNQESCCGLHNTMENNNFDDSMLKNPKSVDQIINQREALISQLSNFLYECTICYAKLKPHNPIWSCDNCYHMFHIDCIKRWYKTCVDDVTNVKWRCPTCQKEYSINEVHIVHHCFCGKLKNPDFKRGTLMHSCGDVCGKSNKTNGRCLHLCSLQCHPGPCPPCDASITSQCHCAKITLTVICSSGDKHLICGKTCDKPLNCDIHICEALCHPSHCAPCTASVTQLCYCRQESRTIICGSPFSSDSFFSCDRICDNLCDCNNHRCGYQCHSGDCRSCEKLPANVEFCNCGKTPLGNLVESRSPTGDRKSCMDDIPSCAEPCHKCRSGCEHRCLDRCHQGDCSPCLLSSSVRCRCGKSTQLVKCSEIIRQAAIGRTPVQCSARCRARKSCGNHRCAELCCAIEVHICDQPCQRQLSCKRHLCERSCHVGRCAPCHNVSFDELFCHCGACVALPPIACGQIPPVCELACKREHSCLHKPMHNCHSESQCPPCTVLTTKDCPGGHRAFPNVPCFRPVVTCGLPCQLPLGECQHRCTRDCHTGPCTDTLFQCVQSCCTTRPDCGHPCGAPCHKDECSVAMPRLCPVLVELRCGCSRKSMSVTCHKLRRAISSAANRDTSSLSNTKKDNALIDQLLLLADDNREPLMRCDSNCKRAAQLKQQTSAAFDGEIGWGDNGCSYTGFLRDFSTKDPQFLMKVDNEFVQLIQKLEVVRR